MMFRNRSEAGRRLAKALAHYKKDDPLVLALPRGGVAVAVEIALALNAALDLILVRKLGVPWQPELAMGAVVDGEHPYVVRNEDILAQINLTGEEFREICERELDEIERRRRLYLQGLPREDVEGRTVIVVDDGIATGATTRAALLAVRNQRPRWLVLAVPVAPASTLEELSPETNDIVCLSSPEPFYSIGQFYEDFRQISDKEVIAMLSKVSKAAQVPRTEDAPPAFPHGVPGR